MLKKEQQKIKKVMCHKLSLLIRSRGGSTRSLMVVPDANRESVAT
jgi:hypothetical protein